ncbi:MAG: NrfD/PsrC family molybdoenzyme membrane anchor subunit [Gaiellaceae bacterium]
MKTASSPVDAASYYGRPILKPPVWEADIPVYFFLGGMAGASSLLALGARLTGNDRLARNATYVNAASLTVSPALLIHDLGRPERFLNMLRVFKITSPMSVGTWIVSASGSAAGGAATLEVLGLAPRLRFAAESGAALLGPFLSTYTAALVTQSVVPIWHEVRRELPFVFAGSSAASAGGAAAILTPALDARPARRLAVAGAALELLATRAMRRRLGPLGRPYEEGLPGTLAKLAEGATLAGGTLMALAGRRRAGAVAAGALLLTGSVAQRFAVVKAGTPSALDPSYVTVPQRARLAGR